MILTSLLLVNSLALFVIEVIGHHVCHSGKLCLRMNDPSIDRSWFDQLLVVMLLDGYYHLCLTILCTVRIVSRRVSAIVRYHPIVLHGSSSDSIRLYAPTYLWVSTR